jgi:hypothetical protein
MLTKYLAAAVIGSALIAAPAMAQTTDKNSNSATSAQQSNQKPAEQNASATGLWQGSKLINLNVYNNNNEKIGDIKELMLDKSGKIDTAVIAVGGFLGMGEHDVAVKFSELKFTDEPVRSSSTSTTSSTNTASTRPSSTTGSSNTTMTGSKRNYPDHAVFNATKDQLKSMPQFNYNK